MIGSRAVAFFSDHEEEADVADAVFEEIFRGEQHAGDDAFGIAGAASPDVFIVFAGRDEGRDGVHVGGEGDDRVAEGGEYVAAAGLDFHGFEMAVVGGAEAGQVIAQVQTDLFLFGSHGRDVD